ncbi:hypothetical protein I3843_15G054500 [Carya illinoinensis]|uniref:EF-hand domain-containing protein n=1 Tax=Carya illinoinensis TaxID=32201 RepID=A0A8T1N4L0_CARIL|nr:hypothetical protein I3760_15G056900 [Carya illinoinensis]KAG6626576.1 hypothetical protein CIPAW_15G059200 [Carya illinoinensis]KAG6674704.1 hypothetical protein I3842_15G057700 [Carya illinoinensis]KAG7943677.1 hypothetical protein I3843_15G054500 [Carya illinoinensis]
MVPFPFKLSSFPQISYTKEELTNVFKKNDINGDGKLSWLEMIAAFEELGSRWPWFRAKDGFAHADQGKNGYIDIKTELELLVDYAYKCNYTKKN